MHNWPVVQNPGCSRYSQVSGYKLIEIRRANGRRSGTAEPSRGRMGAYYPLMTLGRPLLLVLLLR